VDAVTFASPSAVAGWVGMLRAAGLPPNLSAGTVLACIGPTTAEAAREAGLEF
jgi:uroporphyrinogen-III synthase